MAVLDVDELAAADRAVRADRLDDVLGAFDPRLQRRGPRRLDRAAEPESVTFPQLPEDRPPAGQLAKPHRAPSLPRRASLKGSYSDSVTFGRGVGRPRLSRRRAGRARAPASRTGG